MTEAKKTKGSEKASTPTKGLSADELFEVEAQEKILKASLDSMETREEVYRGLAKR